LYTLDEVAKSHHFLLFKLRVSKWLNIIKLSSRRLDTPYKFYQQLKSISSNFAKG